MYRGKFFFPIQSDISEGGAIGQCVDCIDFVIVAADSAVVVATRLHLAFRIDLLLLLLLLLLLSLLLLFLLVMMDDNSMHC